MGDKDIAILCHNTERNATETLSILEPGYSFNVDVEPGVRFALVGLLEDLKEDTNDSTSHH